MPNRDDSPRGSAGAAGCGGKRHAMPCVSSSAIKRAFSARSVTSGSVMVCAFATRWASLLVGARNRRQRQKHRRRLRAIEQDALDLGRRDGDHPDPGAVGAFVARVKGCAAGLRICPDPSAHCRAGGASFQCLKDRRRDSTGDDRQGSGLDVGGPKSGRSGMGRAEPLAMPAPAGTCWPRAVAQARRGAESTERSAEP